MKWMVWLRRRKWESGMDSEMRFHMDVQIRDYVRRGISQEEAERLVRQEFGPLDLAKDECRDQMPLAWLDHLWRDVRLAFRVLTRQPGFLIIAVLTLALGIGANTAIFSVVKAVLLEPLAYREPDRIVAVQTLWTKTNRAGNVSGGDYPDLVGEPSPFAAATRYAGGELPVETSGQAEFVPAYGTDAGFADVFQLKPVAGRLITADEFRTKANVALVSEGFAVRHFGEANRALGQVVHLEENALAIVGVLPGVFHFPLKAEL